MPLLRLLTGDGVGCDNGHWCLADPRQRGKISYPLDEILLLCLLAVLAGAETFVDIALFGTKKLALLRRFRPFSGGTPAHDHLGDILAALDAEQSQRCFVAWVAQRIGAPDGVIAIDGEAGARLAARLAIPTSPDTLLRLAQPGYRTGQSRRRACSGSTIGPGGVAVATARCW